MTATPDTIDWAHVAQQFKWMARDIKGDVAVFTAKPIIDDSWDAWITEPTDMGNYGFLMNIPDDCPSYRRGTCDWRDSLVQRPVGV